MGRAFNGRNYYGRKLSGKSVAILAADGFEQVELTKPRAALDEGGRQYDCGFDQSGKIQGMNHADRGDTVGVDRTLEEASPKISTRSRSRAD
jgi:protease I